MRKALAAISVGMMMASTPAQAWTFKAAPNLTFDMTQMAEPGRFTKWTATDLTGLNAFQAGAAFQFFGRDPKWAPSFSVSLLSGAQRVSLTASGAQGQPMFLHLDTFEGQELVSVEGFKLKPDSSDAIDIKIHWSQDGVVTVLVGRSRRNEAERLTAKLPAAPDSLTVGTSTAFVNLVPLQLGTGSP